MSSSVKQSLSGEWQFRRVGNEDWLPALVPGGVHTDLLRAGRINDPFVGDEEKRVKWVAEQDWEYRRTFVVDSALLSHDRLFLVCDGLDTLATVFLNGQSVGSVQNMFRGYRWDVRSILQPGENELRVLLRSPARYAAERNEARPLPDVNNPLPGGPYLRKVPSHFGWDWGPRLPAVGIWRDIRLETYDMARLEDVHIRQEHLGGCVNLSAEVDVERYEGLPLRLLMCVTSPQGNQQQAEVLLPEVESGRSSEHIALTIDDPLLWWPNGLGAQPLYDVEITLVSGDSLLSTRSYKVGLRTIELRQEPDVWGTSFTFVVNGVPIFAKGSNWIPPDSFPTRITRGQLEHLLGSAAAANHNMVRVWGGGFYESDDFYDLCDRYGLLVWQDFIFACAGYPLNDEEYLENVHAEVEENVRRLRHRASLALWCGNNEIETAWVSWGWNTPENADLMQAYERFFDHVLPQWVAAEDPDRPYWPSSPSSGGGFDDPNGNRAGDVHQWAVWHSNRPFSDYRETPARFVSEFGFESLPAPATVAAFAERPDWNIASYVMEYHQRSPVGNEKIVLYLLETFRLPKNFESLVYLSQLLQAEAMRVGVEHWRRHPACSGALYWQLNDCWPVISWSSIDYFGRWKALHYSSRRFFAPVLLSVEDNGTNLGLFVTNDSTEAWSGSVRWSLERLQGERLDSGETAVNVAPLATVNVKELDFASAINDDDRRRTIFVCELWQDGKQAVEPLQSSVVTFVPTKHVALEEPGLRVEMDTVDSRLRFHVQASSFARFVALSLEGADVIFSDNYFDLPAGRTVEITCAQPDGWTLEQAREALRIRSVFDSY